MKVLVTLSSVLVFCGLVSATAASSGNAAPAKPQVFEESLPSPSMTGHFSLHALDGKPVTAAQFRGKWMLVYIGYTKCPDVCPTVLNVRGVALIELGPRAK